MDLLLSEFLKEHPKVDIVQPKNLFYGEYHHRIRLSFNRGQDTRRCQRELLYLINDDNAADEIMTRAERGRLSIFYNSDKTFQSVIDTLKQIYVHKDISAENHIYEVTHDKLDLARKTLHVPTIKKKGFNYKVTIQTGWDKFSAESKQRLVEILSQDWSNYRLTDATYLWLNSSTQTSNWAGKYFYVKDGTMVTFLQLSCSDLIDQVYEII